MTQTPSSNLKEETISQNFCTSFPIADIINIKAKNIKVIQSNPVTKTQDFLSAQECSVPHFSVVYKNLQNNKMTK